MIDTEFFITGEPIPTEFGDCRFIKVKEYAFLTPYLSWFKMSKKEIIYTYSKITSILPNFKEAYEVIFSTVFNGVEILEKLTPENFEALRELVLIMSCLKEEKISSNPEIQRANERSKRVKSQDSDMVDMADIMSSVAAHTGYLYKDINEMTLFQLYMTYYRVGQFKQYDTSILFATVSPDAAKHMESWGKHIDLFEEEKHYISRESFMKQTKGFGKGSA
ncbi:hypothetical protein NSA31_04785 [Bacillus subtilis]|uniref:hypothetical protein n=1 Tax=Bacillus subtilis TaxID=1423 RepID=UPI00214A5C47|nr:hypothetical protein [Bacillus subtilis]MCR1991107.1 hypothetical protein [Bacillus subtilis]